MLKNYARQVHTLLVLTELVLTGGTLFALAFLGWIQVEDPMPRRLLVLGLGASLLWPLILEYSGLYASQRRNDLFSALTRLTRAGLLVGALVVGASFALGWPISPLEALLLVGCQTVLLGGLRVGAWVSLGLLRRRGRNYRNVIILGSGPRAHQVRNEIDEHPEWGLRIVAFIDDGDTPVDPELPAERVHKFQDLPQILADNVVDEALLACPRSLLPMLAPTVALLAEVGVPVTLLSDLFGDLVPAPRVTHFGSMTALSFAPVHHGRFGLATKRAIDIVGASLALLVSGPVIALCAAAIKATSSGPVFFRQVRCGLRGRPFVMVKLRTMCIDAETRRMDLVDLNEMDGPVFKIQEDPRVTPVGRILRRFSLDELPQFWNVLRGDMSLVGPRPPLPAEVAQYRNRDRRRLSMRPGLTCLWQVSGRNRIGFDEWMDMDLNYIDQWSLLSDARIMLKTPAAVARGEGAS